MNITTIAREGVMQPAVKRNRERGQPFGQSNTRGKIGLTIEEVAAYTGIGKNTIRQLVGWGKIPILKIGRKMIVRADIVDRFMEVNQGVDLLDQHQVRGIG